MDLLFFVFITSLLSGCGFGQKIISHPANLAQTAGEIAKFVCKVDFGSGMKMINWRFNNKVLYSYTEGSSNCDMTNNKYVVIKEQDTYILEVRNLNFDDGGQYTCVVPGSEATAVLFVLGSPFIEKPTISPQEGEIAIYKCVARYGGPYKEVISDGLYPEIRMTLGGSTLEAKQSHGNQSHLINEYEILVNGSIHNKELLCEVSSPHKSVHSVINIDVLYLDSDVTYYPPGVVFENGSSITCMAKGNPAPSFEWISDEGTRIKGQVLNITNNMEGQNKWKCIATNYIRQTANNNHIEFIAVASIKDFLENYGQEKFEYPLIFIGSLVIITVLVPAAAATYIFCKNGDWKWMKKVMNKKNSMMKNNGAGKG